MLTSSISLPPGIEGCYGPPGSRPPRLLSRLLSPALCLSRSSEARVRGNRPISFSPPLSPFAGARGPLREELHLALSAPELASPRS